MLFLDEPTVGLDPQTRDHIWKYIIELKKAQNITVVLTTHYMDEADRLCDRIGIMDHGKIVILDTPPKLKDTLEGDVVVVRTNKLDELSELVTKSLGFNNKQIVDGRFGNNRSTMAKLLCLESWSWQPKITFMWNLCFCVNLTLKTYFCITLAETSGKTQAKNCMEPQPHAGGQYDE